MEIKKYAKSEKIILMILGATGRQIFVFPMIHICILVDFQENANSQKYLFYEFEVEHLDFRLLVNLILVADMTVLIILMDKYLKQDFLILNYHPPK